MNGNKVIPTLSSSIQKILVVDDSESYLKYLTELLTKLNYTVSSCTDGESALKFLESNEYAVIILDWMMPKMSGIDLCRKIRQRKTETYPYIILLTSRTSSDDIVSGLDSGADDYLTKPCDVQELQTRIKIGMRLYSYGERLVRQETEVRISCYQTLTELAEQRDQETGAHLSRIAKLSVILAREVGLSDEDCALLELFAPMHDIGKVGIPDGILHLPRRLTPQEFAVMKTHTQIGWGILKDKEAFSVAASIAYTHHEKWDGSGYPQGLKGEEIPLFGRIVSIVDVYDALRSVRPYKQSFYNEESVAWIKSQSGYSFDPHLVECFLKVQDKICSTFEHLQDCLADTHPSDRLVVTRRIEETGASDEEIIPD